MIEIAPSILNANLVRLEEEVTKIANADWLHFDVMDGHFVPNLTFGPMFISELKKVSSLPMEAHLMVSNPEFFVPLYAEAGSKRIIIHAEASIHLDRLVQMIKSYGCEVGVALNPASPLETLEYILPELDVVLLMTVNPGYGGQKLIPYVLSKISKLHQIIQGQNFHCKLGVDGGVNWQNVQELVGAGADLIVAGTLLYNDPEPEKALQRLRDIVNKGGNCTVL